MPAIDSNIEPYELQVVGAEIDFEREQIADFLGQQDHLDLAESAARLSVSFGNPDLSSAYSNTSPFVGHFISVELDTHAPKGPGIGRLLGGAKPDPRFGSRFGKGLLKAGSREEIGRCFERMILVGFMGQLVYGELNMIPPRTFGASTTVATREKYEEWIKFFPSLANQVFLKSMDLKGGPSGDASAELYMWAKNMPPATDYELACKRFGIKGRLGTSGNREMFAITCYSAGWILGNLFSEIAEL